jgi:hypothetical protein
MWLYTMHMCKRCKDAATCGLDLERKHDYLQHILQHLCKHLIVEIVYHVILALLISCDVGQGPPGGGGNFGAWRLLGYSYTANIQCNEMRTACTSVLVLH